MKNLRLLLALVGSPAAVALAAPAAPAVAISNQSGINLFAINPEANQSFIRWVTEQRVRTHYTPILRATTADEAKRREVLAHLTAEHLKLQGLYLQYKWTASQKLPPPLPAPFYKVLPGLLAEQEAGLTRLLSPAERLEFRRAEVRASIHKAVFAMRHETSYDPADAGDALTAADCDRICRLLEEALVTPEGDFKESQQTALAELAPRAKAELRPIAWRKFCGKWHAKSHPMRIYIPMSMLPADESMIGRVLTPVP